MGFKQINFRIDDEIAKRKKIVERYREHLDGIKGIQLSPIQADVVSNYAYFPIIIDEEVFGKSRDEVSDRLAQNGIFSRKYFYPITNSFDCYKGIFNPNDTPIALEISKKVLTLPLYADLEMDVIDDICKLLIRQ